MSYCDKEAIEAINNQKKRRETWRAFAARLHQQTGIQVNHGLLCSVFHGKKRSDVVRLALGLKPLKKHQPIPCSDCGKYHTVAWCVERDGEPVRPKQPTYNKKRKQIRLAASVTEEQREKLHILASEYGLTWSELCQKVATDHIMFWPFPKKGTADN